MPSCKSTFSRAFCLAAGFIIIYQHDFKKWHLCTNIKLQVHSFLVRSLWYAWCSFDFSFYELQKWRLFFLVMPTPRRVEDPISLLVGKVSASTVRTLLEWFDILSPLGTWHLYVYLHLSFSFYNVINLFALHFTHVLANLGRLNAFGPELHRPKLGRLGRSGGSCSPQRPGCCPAEHDWQSGLVRRVWLQLAGGESVVVHAGLKRSRDGGKSAASHRLRIHPSMLPVRRLLEMNERERKIVLKNVTVTLALMQNLPSCVKRIATGPLATHQISVQSVQPFPRYGEVMHTCTRAAVPSGYR